MENVDNVVDWVRTWDVKPIPSEEGEGLLDFEVTVSRPSWAETVEDQPDEISLVLNTGLPEFLWELGGESQEIIANKIRMKVYEEMWAAKMESVSGD